jgi:hypothetical protein
MSEVEFVKEWPGWKLAADNTGGESVAADEA